MLKGITMRFSLVEASAIGLLAFSPVGCGSSTALVDGGSGDRVFDSDRSDGATVGSIDGTTDHSIDNSAESDQEDMADGSLPAVAPPMSVLQEPRLGHYDGPLGIYTNGSGWDFCVGEALIRGSQCPQCVAPPDGSPFLVHSGPVVGDSDPQHSQAYTYFIPPVVVDGPRGLWFDLGREDAGPIGNTLTLFLVDSGCGTLQSVGTFRIDPLLQGPGWASTCVTLPIAANISGIGFRIDGSAEIGIDEFRIGAPCP
jgi:hypothetical protein